MIKILLSLIIYTSCLTSAVVEDIVILGSGPAGLTAAIYAARGGYSPLVIEGEEPGGQLTGTANIENYPGFPDPMHGIVLTDLFREQANRFGTRFKQGTVIKADLSKRPYIVTLEDGTEVLAKTIIIATGASPKWLGLSSETALKGYGVGSCAVCEGAFYKDQRVVVVGGGDSALEDALYLARIAKEVTLIHRSQSFKASQILIQRAKENPRIVFVTDSVIEEIKDVSKQTVESVVIRNVKTNQLKTLDTDAVFIAIGHRPNTSLFDGQLELDPQGYIQIQPFSAKTSIKGVFAAGDVADPRYRQAVTAAGMGAMAALDALQFLETE